MIPTPTINACNIPAMPDLLILVIARARPVSDCLAKVKD